MKRTSLLATALLALGFVFSTTGCATASRSTATAPKHTPTYALIVSVSGGLAPTDAQWATMQKKFADALEARGLVLVTDPTYADKLIQVLFVPDIDDPTTGISYVMGIRDNPSNLLPARTSMIASNVSFSSGYPMGMGYNSFGLQPQYYGYYNDYTDTRITSTTYPSVTPPTVTPPTTTPPHHGGGHHVTRPIDCPPETPHHPPSTYAGRNPPSGNSGGGGHWGNPRPRDSDSGYSASAYNSSSRSSSDFVGPTASYSSRSSSDYVGPTSSYSSSSSSSQSMSFPSSSSSSSSYSAPSMSFPSAPMESSSSSSDSGPRSFATAPQERP
jgi:hypothetical protein